MKPLVRMLLVAVATGSAGTAGGYALARWLEPPMCVMVPGGCVPWDFSLHQDLAFGPGETWEYLDAIIALEEKTPTSERSAGCEYSRRANRYIAASRLRTLINLDNRDPLLVERVKVLHEALDRYSMAFVKAVDASYTTNSGQYRSTRMDLVAIERLLREQVSCLRPGEFPDPRASQSLLRGFEERILRSGWQSTEEPDRVYGNEVFAYEGQDVLIAALPDLREALAGFSPELTDAIETELRCWIDDYLPETNLDAPSTRPRGM